MTWLRYPASTWGLDAQPLDAGLGIDVVRGNLRHLMQQPPAGSAGWIVNGTRYTGSTAYDDASVLWRGASRQLRAGLGATVRDLGFRVGLYMSAGTATVRAMAVCRFAIGGAGSTSIESAVGAVVSVDPLAPTELTLTLPLVGLGQTFLTSFGSGGDGRGVTLYYATYLLVQAKVNAGPNLCYLRSCTPYEVDPT